MHYGNHHAATPMTPIMDFPRATSRSNTRDMVTREIATRNTSTRENPNRYSYAPPATAVNGVKKSPLMNH